MIPIVLIAIVALSLAFLTCELLRPRSALDPAIGIISAVAMSGVLVVLGIALYRLFTT